MGFSCFWQAIAWLQELLQVMLSQHVDIGRTAAEAENLRKDHNKFEDTARVSILSYKIIKLKDTGHYW